MHQVVQDPVNQVFLVDSDIPVAQEVVLQRTELDARPVGDVLYVDTCIIGQAGPGADRSELVRVDRHDDFPSGILIREGLQHIYVDG